MTDEIVSAYQPENVRALERDVSRLRPVLPENPAPLALRYSDFDYNGHVHNTRYAELAWNAVPDPVKESARLTGMRICYVKAIKRGAEVTSGVDVSDGGVTVSLFAGGEPAAAAEFRLG
jgi:acyl-ACP thioesterase